MAVIKMKPGKTEAVLTARGRASRIPPELLEAPGGLYPLQSAAFQVDEYRILAGWPVPVPDHDIHIDVLVSADGNILGNRENPTTLVTNADMRWVADATLYDENALRWRPLQSNVSPWETSVDHSPTLVTNYEYRVGHEKFIGMTALNFDSTSQDYMWIDLTLSMGGTMGYTVIMVLCPNSIYGNDPGVENNGLWGPDQEGESYSYFTVADKSIWLNTEAQGSQKGVTIANGLAMSGPIYVALVVGRPQTVMYAASGTSSFQAKSLLAGPDPVPLSTRFRLGWGPGPTSATMDMALLDVGLYGTLLSRPDVLTEITKLSQVYGGDS
jgi:hypothetical protein